MTAITINLDRIIQLTNEQFYQLCRNNPEIKFERNHRGEIIIRITQILEINSQALTEYLSVQQWID